MPSNASAAAPSIAAGGSWQAAGASLHSAGALRPVTGTLRGESVRGLRSSTDAWPAKRAGGLGELHARRLGRSRSTADEPSAGSAGCRFDGRCGGRRLRSLTRARSGAARAPRRCVAIAASCTRAVADASASSDHSTTRLAPRVRSSATHARRTGADRRSAHLGSRRHICRKELQTDVHADPDRRTGSFFDY